MKNELQTRERAKRIETKLVEEIETETGRERQYDDMYMSVTHYMIIAGS